MAHQRRTARLRARGGDSPTTLPALGRQALRARVPTVLARHRPTAIPIMHGTAPFPLPSPAGRPPLPTAQQLCQVLTAITALPAAQKLRHLVDMGLGQLPPPGEGATLARWQALAEVARHSLALAKLYEGHTDALAILGELGSHAARSGQTWAMWAAEAPGLRVQVTPFNSGDYSAELSGIKAWCSGAQGVSHALLTVWLPGEAQSQLVAVDLSHPGIRVDTGPWQAVGMADTLSADVCFDRTPATLVGKPGDYLRRPGFWHGGAGIAACWYGGTCAVADALFEATRSADPTHPAWPYRAAALGRVDRSLAGLAALLQRSAGWIDANPQADAQAVALRLRQAAEAAAQAVLEETGRALGATPFCRDAGFARAAADLPVFIRQSHGDRDDAALARAILTMEESPWDL